MRLVEMVPGPGPRDDAVCVVAGDRSLTGRELRSAVAACAARLRDRGVTRGQRLLALVDHDERGVVLLAAASLLGVRLVMPYNLAAAAAPEWLAMAETARPDLVVSVRRDPAGVPGLAAAGHPVLDLGSDEFDGPDGPDGPLDPVLFETGDAAPVEQFLVLFTSGTTGSPKAIAVSEELVARRVASVSRALGFGRASRILLAGLLTNTTGVIFAFGALLRGATLVVPRDRDVATWPAQVAADRVTHLMLRPVALRHFLDGAGSTDLGSLRVVAYGAAAMPGPLLARAMARIPCDWVQGYGLSETYGPFCWLDAAAHRAGRQERGAYCVGRPDTTVEVRIEPLAGHPDGIGEVLVRGTRMEGYLDVATGVVTSPDEWLRTGDLGTWSNDGDLLLKGRIAGSLLTANGHRTYPAEVEAVLARVAGVDDAVLVGALPAGADPADPMARVPVACLSGPIGELPPAAVAARVTAALRGVLSREKWPDRVLATTEPFPSGTNGKVLRPAVADLAVAAPPIRPEDEMSTPCRATHSVVCNAAPERVYEIVSDTQRWPDVLEPCESVTVLERSADAELVEVTANVGGQRQTWRSRRRFRPEALGVDARIVEPMPLVEAMSTQWRVVGLNAAQSLLVLEHDYTLCTDVSGLVPGVETAADATRFLAAAIDRNSATELADIAVAAERGGSGRDFHARHTVVCDAPADAVYPFVRDAANWPRIFDNCVGATTVAAVDGSGDGTGEIVRIEAVQQGRPATWDTRRRYADDIRRIDYDLPVPMPLLESMSGQWRVVELDDERCVLTVDRWWRVLADVRGIRPGIETVAQAAEFVAAVVGDNAAAEMASIKALVERPGEETASVVTRMRVPHPPDEVYAALADVLDRSATLPERVARRLHLDEPALTISYATSAAPDLVDRRSSWQVRSVEGESEVVARHEVTLARDAEPGADLAAVRERRARLRERLGEESRAIVAASTRTLGGPVARTGIAGA